MLGSPEVAIVSDRRRLSGLRAEWDEAAPPKLSEPWQSFSWIEACAETCSKNHRLHVITVRRAGRLTAAAPLVLRESNQPLRPLRLEFLGAGELKEPNRFLASDATSMDVLTDQIVAERTYPVRLSRVPNDRDAVRLLSARFRRAGWVTKAVSMPYPYLQLAKQAILFKKSLKEDLSRARRKAIKLGEVRSEIVDVRSRDRVISRLQDAFRIEASGWKGANNTAIICNDPRREFFERLAASAMNEGTLRLVFLKVGGEDAAVQYAIEAANAYWLLNIGYNDDFRECSPGNLLLEETIKAAAKNGLARYNFLGKEEAWTRRWTSDVEDCVVLAAYRPNSLGFRAIISDALYLYRKRREDRIVNEIKKGRAVQGRVPRLVEARSAFG